MTCGKSGINSEAIFTTNSMLLVKLVTKCRIYTKSCSAKNQQFEETLILSQKIGIEREGLEMLDNLQVCLK